MGKIRNKKWCNHYAGMHQKDECEAGSMDGMTSCACGQPDGQNIDNCERCRLIARIAELEAEVEACHNRMKLIEQKYHKAKDTSNKFAQCGAVLNDDIARLKNLLREAFPLLNTAVDVHLRARMQLKIRKELGK